MYKNFENIIFIICLIVTTIFLYFFIKFNIYLITPVEHTEKSCTNSNGIYGSLECLEILGEERYCMTREKLRIEYIEGFCFKHLK